MGEPLDVVSAHRGLRKAGWTVTLPVRLSLLSLRCPRKQQLLTEDAECGNRPARERLPSRLSFLTPFAPRHPAHSRSYSRSPRDRPRFLSPASPRSRPGGDTHRCSRGMPDRPQEWTPSVQPFGRKTVVLTWLGCPQGPRASGPAMPSRLAAVADEALRWGSRPVAGQLAARPPAKQLCVPSPHRVTCPCQRLGSTSPRLHDDADQLTSPTSPSSFIRALRSVPTAVPTPRAARPPATPAPDRQESVSAVPGAVRGDGARRFAERGR